MILRFKRLTNMVVIRRSSSCLSVLDLNDDCIFNILLYLPLIERLKFAYACDSFDDIIFTFLRYNTFTVSYCCTYLSLQEVEQVLSRFGLYIKRLALDVSVNEESIKVYKLIADYCENIEAIELHYPSHSEYKDYLSLLYRITSTSKDIQSVHVERKIFTDDWPNPWYYRVLEEKICEIISNLPNLRRLYLRHFYKATGKFLNKLATLTHLDIEYCVNFKSEHFIQLCESMKLKMLNIDNCTFLNDETVDALVETQTDLETLTVSTEFNARNFRKIGRMKSLKELIVYDYYGGRTMDGLLDEIVEYHRDDFRILKIFTNAPQCTVEDHKVFRQGLLALKNLKILCLPHECLAENYLVDISTKLSKLEQLRFNFEENKRGTDNRAGRIEIVRNSRKRMTAHSEFILCLEILHRIIEARCSLNFRLLTIYLNAENISQNVLKVNENFILDLVRS